MEVPTKIPETYFPQPARVKGKETFPKQSKSFQQRQHMIHILPPQPDTHTNLHTNTGTNKTPVYEGTHLINFLLRFVFTTFLIRLPWQKFSLLVAHQQTNAFPQFHPHFLNFPFSHPQLIPREKRSGKPPTPANQVYEGINSSDIHTHLKAALGMCVCAGKTSGPLHSIILL